MLRLYDNYGLNSESIGFEKLKILHLKSELPCGMAQSLKAYQFSRAGRMLNDNRDDWREA